MSEHPTCPLCETDLNRCSGTDDMPASQEYWQCHRCGLSAHVSFLLTEAARQELKHRFVSDLRRRVKEGRNAQTQLRAAGFSGCEGSGSYLLFVGIGALIGVLLSRCLRQK